VDENSVAAARLRTAIELAGATLLMTREHFRRQQPAASEEELSALVNEWLAKQHRAEFSDPVFRLRAPARPV
jgi:hypothetical protein